MKQFQPQFSPEPGREPGGGRSYFDLGKDGPKNEGPKKEPREPKEPKEPGNKEPGGKQVEGRDFVSRGAKEGVQQVLDANTTGGSPYSEAQVHAIIRQLETLKATAKKADAKYYSKYIKKYREMLEPKKDSKPKPKNERNSKDGPVR